MMVRMARSAVTGIMMNIIEADNHGFHSLSKRMVRAPRRMQQRSTVIAIGITIELSCYALVAHRSILAMRG